MKLHIEMKWNDDLEDQNSAAFKELSSVFEKEVNTPYTTTVHTKRQNHNFNEAYNSLVRKIIFLLSTIKGNVILGNTDSLRSVPTIASAHTCITQRFSSTTAYHVCCGTTRLRLVVQQPL